MCGRYAITLPPEAVRQWFRTQGEIPNWPVYYNAAPTTALPIVRQNKDGQREIALITWGLAVVRRLAQGRELSYATPHGIRHFHHAAHELSMNNHSK